MSLDLVLLVGIHIYLLLRISTYIATLLKRKKIVLISNQQQKIIEVWINCAVS